MLGVSVDGDGTAEAVPKGLASATFEDAGDIAASADREAGLTAIAPGGAAWQAASVAATIAAIALDGAGRAIARTDRGTCRKPHGSGRCSIASSPVRSKCMRARARKSFN
jgi:hypothetical protein